MDKSKQAFPVPCQAQQGGMTLREYYAGLAMQGLIPTYEGGAWAREGAERLADEAILLADAIIARLEEEK